MSMTLQMTRPTRAAEKVAPAPATGSHEAAFVLELLEQFGRHGIGYCVLRNHRGLLSGSINGDVDLQVEDGAIGDAVRIADRIAARYGGVRIVFTRWAGMVRTCYCGSAHGTWWGVRLDITRRQTYRGVEFCDSDAILRDANLRHGIRVARPADAAMLALLKDILSTGRTKPKYVVNAQQAFRGDEALWRRRLGARFGTRAARALGQFLESPAAAPAQIARRLRRGLMVRAFLTRPLATLRGRLTSVRDRLRRLFDRPGVFIAVTGTDGSGKSTLIDAIRRPLRDALRSEVRREHLRPNLLPSIARLLGRPVENGPATNPHGSRPSGPLGSLMRLAYYTLDYVFGYWLKVYPALVRWPCLYVFDRYFYDYCLDPRRGRIVLPQWILRLFSLLVPRPDLVLCLGGRPEAIHRRKTELPLAEVERQVTWLRRFCDRALRAVWIDTAEPVETAVDQALRAVTAMMTTRAMRRY